MNIPFGALFGIVMFILGSTILFSERGRKRILRGYKPGGYGTFIIRGFLPMAVAEIFFGLTLILVAVMSIIECV